MSSRGLSVALEGHSDSPLSVDDDVLSAKIENIKEGVGFFVIYAVGRNRVGFQVKAPETWGQVRYDCGLASADFACVPACHTFIGLRRIRVERFEKNREIHV
ncbi:MAG TPA: hypothetical protein DD440_07665 [Porticoccaceae bacterium]|nr:hypothetical protein [Porticoccaceae bacterium]|tara:strand:- start:204 stop:509 length:306 start_codon:yes stop_codon:yes gene_type:complete